MLCHERLLFLQEHDDSSGSDYMRTLRCYLDNHCNVVQTARELFYPPQYPALPPEKRSRKF